jgi:hypothetical protein
MRDEDRQPDRVRSRSVADLMTLMLAQKKEIARAPRARQVFRPFGFGKRRDTAETPRPRWGAR